MNTIVKLGVVSAVAATLIGARLAQEASPLSGKGASTARRAPFSRVNTPAWDRAYAAGRRADLTSRTPESLPRIVQGYRSALAETRDPGFRLGLADALVRRGGKGDADEARDLYHEFARDLATGRLAYGGSDPGPVLRAADNAGRLGLRDESAYLLATLTRGPIHQIDARFQLPELDEVPDHARANGLFAAGIGKLRIHHNEEAVGLFERVVRERPDWRLARFMLAYANGYAGHPEAADRGFAEAVRFGFARPKGM